MKKEAVDNLIKDMVHIMITEVDTMIDKSSIVVNYKTDKRVSKLISQSIGKYNLDWSNDIIRDEVIATLYESMIKVSKDFNEWDISLDNPEFIGKAYRLTEILLKERLIGKHKLNRSGSIIELYEDLYSPLAEEGQATSKLEDLLNQRILIQGNEEKLNHFNKWFEANKEKILTKKQLNFVNGELIDIDRTSACKLRKRIADRVIKQYEEKYKNLSIREVSLMDQKEIIEQILEAKDLKAALEPYMEEDFIIDALLDNVSPEAAKAFNTGSKDPLVIKEYRVALFKRLGKIHDILMKNKTYDKIRAMHGLI